MEAKDGNNISQYSPVGFLKETFRMPPDNFGGETIVYNQIPVPNIGNASAMLIHRSKSDIESLYKKEGQPNEVIVIEGDLSIKRVALNEIDDDGLFHLALSVSRQGLTDGTLTTTLGIENSEEDGLMCSSEGRVSKSEERVFDILYWRQVVKGGKKVPVYLRSDADMQALDFGFMFIPHQGGDTR